MVAFSIAACLAASFGSNRRSFHLYFCGELWGKDGKCLFGGVAP